MFFPGEGIVSDPVKNEKPEVYALRQDGGTWEISRRDFLKAAGIGAAAMGIGAAGCSTKEDLVQVTPTPTALSDLCKTAPAHERSVDNICLSIDDRYLVSGAFNTLKCWDLKTYALLGSLSHGNLRDYELMSTGRIYGKSCVFSNGNGSDHVQYYELPFTNESAKQNLPVKKYFRRDMLVDSSGSFYGMDNDGIYYSGAADDYASIETIYKLDGSNYPKSIQLADEERKLFVQLRERSFHLQENGSCGILDLETRILTQFEGGCYLYALTPDGKRVLINDAADDSLLLVSVADGSVIWKISGKDTGFSYVSSQRERIKGMAISMDMEWAFLVGGFSLKKGGVSKISMADGTFQGSLPLGEVGNIKTPVVMTKDGSKMILAYNNSIVIISVPDMQIIACLSDVNAMPDNTEGIELSQTDPETGVVYSYTLPGGAEIPAGAVCTCNTVAGKISTACTCDGHKCSCDANRSGGGGSHYWHPN